MAQFGTDNTYLISYQIFAQVKLFCYLSIIRLHSSTPPFNNWTALNQKQRSYQSSTITYSYTVFGMLLTQSGQPCTIALTIKHGYYCYRDTLRNPMFVVKCKVRICVIMILLCKTSHHVSFTDFCSEPVEAKPIIKKKQYNAFLLVYLLFLVIY